MKMNTIDFIKEFYIQFNLRGCLEESDKKRLDKSINRVPKKIGHKIDEFLDTIFSSDLKLILKNEYYLTTCKKKSKEILENFELTSSIFNTNIFNSYKFFFIALFSYLNYIMNSEFENFELDLKIMVPRNNFKEKETSIIDNIFKWFEQKYPNLNLWNNIDSKNLYEWRKLKTPIIISTKSIINLKINLKESFPEITDENLEKFTVKLFFGRVMWKNYLDIKKNIPFIGYISYLIYVYFEHSIKKENTCKEHSKKFNSKIFWKKNLTVEKENFSTVWENEDKKKKMLLKIYNSNKDYQNLEIKLKNIKNMNYNEIKENYIELLRIKDSSLGKKTKFIITNYIYQYALKEKDQNFINKFSNELAYKIPLNKKNPNSLKEFFDEDIIVLKLIELVFTSWNSLLEDPFIIKWMIKHTNIIKLIPKVIFLKIKMK